MTYDHLQAVGSDIIGRKLCINPADIYGWLQSQNLKAIDAMKMPPEQVIEQFCQYVRTASDAN